MDIRTGKQYETREAARADGVPDSDIAEVEWPSDEQRRRGKSPKVSFARRTFGSFKNVKGPRKGRR